MRITKGHIRKIVREYGKDYLSKTHQDGGGEEADPRLDYVRENEEEDEKNESLKRRLKKLIREAGISAAIDEIEPELKDMSKAELELLDRKISDLLSQLKEAKRKATLKEALRNMIRASLNEDKSGKGKCPDSGCIEKDGKGKWRIISNKTGKYWPQTYDTKKDAEDGLDAYHASR